MSRKGDYPIPFTRNGTQLNYADRYMTGVVWLENHAVETTISFVRWERGRSAAHAIFEREDNGKEVTVFLSELEPMLQTMVRGKVKGRFTFGKRGANYGMRLADE
jgi:hypothetical protein